MTTVVCTHDLDGQGCSSPATCEDPSRKKMTNLKHVPPRGKYLEYRVSKNCDPHPLLTARIPEWFEFVHFWVRKPSKKISPILLTSGPKKFLFTLVKARAFVPVALQERGSLATPLMPQKVVASRVRMTHKESVLSDPMNN